MPQRVGSEAWRGLLAVALRIVDSLEATGYGKLSFRMGGGTVLAMRFGHRVSNDIDLFIDDAQALGFLTPRLNALALRLASEYEESANALKLVRPEGDIDFILAGPVTRESAQETLDVDGRFVALEPVAEILAKKILYRTASFKPRDVFDVAVAIAEAPAAVQVALAATRSVHPLLSRRLADLRSLDAATSTVDIDATDRGRPSLDGMVERVEAAIALFA